MEPSLGSLIALNFSSVRAERGPPGGRSMSRTARTKSVVCTHCYFRAALPQGGSAWPGLPKYECPRCRTKFLYPMTLPNRVAVLVLLAGMCAYAVLLVLKGDLPIPGVLGLLLVFGIVRDHLVKSEVRAAEARVSNPPRSQVTVSVVKAGDARG